MVICMKLIIFREGITKYRNNLDRIANQAEDHMINIPAKRTTKIKFPLKSQNTSTTHDPNNLR